MLLFNSLEKLHPSITISESQLTKFHEVYEKIGKVKRVCSIGCGPGNDLVGMLAFLQFQFDVSLDEAYLLDWAMDQWSTLLLPLRQKLRDYCKQIYIDTCDVTQPLRSFQNKSLHNFFENDECTVDMFCLSYILTEQRYKWHGFVIDLIQNSSRNAIFYFAEPTTWQLFHLLNLVKEDLIDKINIRCFWMDSSCFLPHLQNLEGRNGPAVLLIVKDS